jgi:hypothetical protein
VPVPVVAVIEVIQATRTARPEGGAAQHLIADKGYA